jgi:hypothetical protein
VQKKNEAQAGRKRLGERRINRPGRLGADREGATEPPSEESRLAARLICLSLPRPPRATLRHRGSTSQPTPIARPTPPLNDTSAKRRFHLVRQRPSTGIRVHVSPGPSRRPERSSLCAVDKSSQTASARPEKARVADNLLADTLRGYGL